MFVPHDRASIPRLSLNRQSNSHLDMIGLSRAHGSTLPPHPNVMLTVKETDDSPQTCLHLSSQGGTACFHPFESRHNPWSLRLVRNFVPKPIFRTVTKSGYDISIMQQPAVIPYMLPDIALRIEKTDRSPYTQDAAGLHTL